MTFEKALGWYQLCVDGKVVFPDLFETDDQLEPLGVSGFAEEPKWPHLITSITLPFHALGAVRAHHLIQPIKLSEVEKVFSNSPAIAWLRQQLLFDLNKYEEWIGSISLIAPNPVLRAMHHKLGKRPDGVESSDISLFLRQSKSLKGLTLHVVEHRPTGVVSHEEFPVTDPYMRVEHVGRTERVATMLKSEDYGLLDYSDPVGFLRSIGLNLELASAKKKVKVPDTPGRPGETYMQTISSDCSTSVMGENSSDISGVQVFYSADRGRERARDAERFGQKWFHGEQKEATNFIRSLISKASKRVYIIDPYFATAELFRFAFATSRFDVEIKILTSAKGLKEVDKIDSTKQAGEVLLAQLHGIKGKSNIEVLVMTGDPPPIHDRFLVVDDNVWLSGNSLHTIGERAGMMIRLPDSQPVLNELFKYMNQESELAKQRVKSLQEWFEARQKATI
jgi:hypothetical protein